MRSVQLALSVEEYGGNAGQQQCRYDVNSRYLCGPDGSDRAVAGERALYKRKGEIPAVVIMRSRTMFVASEGGGGSGCALCPCGIADIGVDLERDRGDGACVSIR